MRTAGNVADGVALGSIEYAVEHPGTPLIAERVKAGKVEFCEGKQCFPTP